jgi:hypothetical protein
LERDLPQNRSPLLRIALAHDPATRARLADKIMRRSIEVEREPAARKSGAGIGLDRAQ